MSVAVAVTVTVVYDINEHTHNLINNTRESIKWKMKTAPFEKRKKNHPNWSWCCGCAVNTHTDTHAHAHGFYLFSFSLYHFINRLDSDTSGFCRVSLTLFSISNNINFIIYSVLSVGSLESVRFIMMTMAIFFFFCCVTQRNFTWIFQPRCGTISELCWV